MGVQLGFMGVSTRRQGHLGWFAGAAAAVRELPGSSGRLSPCLPDDGAPRCGCRRPVLACSSIPADRDHRFRRSGARTGHAARAAPPLFACGMPTRAALVVLAWAGDGSPIRGCTTRIGVQVPPRTRFRIYSVTRPYAVAYDYRATHYRSGIFIPLQVSCAYRSRTLEAVSLAPAHSRRWPEVPQGAGPLSAPCPLPDT